MTRLAVRSVALVAACGFALSGCEEGMLEPPANEPGTSVARQSGTAIRDVERPDIFSTTELALWDGRPSLGGVWVAHPDITEPESVTITNTTNGQSVAGALFRRERNNPGPRIQLSSDAAAALDVLAGQPTELSIVVVRREEIELEPDLTISEEGTEEGTAGSETPDASEGEELAAATIAAIEPIEATEGVVEDGALVEAAPGAEPAKPRGGFWQNFRNSFRKKPDTAAGEIAAAADTAAIVAATEDASAPEVETATLDPVTTTAAAAIEEAEAEQAKPAPTALRNPYIQVGLFREEANANSAASSLRQAGIVPETKETSQGGTTFWRVLVGPVSTADDQAAMLARVRDLGYRDAFLTPN